MLDWTELKPHQREVITSKAKYTLVDGGVGTFKTTACIYKLFYHCLMHPGQRIVVAAQTYDQLINVFVAEWQRQIPSQLYDYVGSPQMKILLKGLDSELILRYAEHPAAAKRIRGISTSGWYIIQAESLQDPGFLDELNERVRLFGPEPNPGYLRLIDANPGSRVHFIYRRFIDKSDDKYVGESHINHIHVVTTPETSAYSQETLNEWKLTHSQLQYRRHILGEWVTAEGLIYERWDPMIHIKSFDPDPNWTWYLTMDFGFRNPFAALIIGIDKENRRWIVDERYESGFDIEQHGEYIASWWKELKLLGGICDPEDPNARMVLQRTLRKHGRLMPLWAADNKFQTGLALCQKALAIDSKGEPVLHVHPRCKNFIDEIGNYTWAPVYGSGSPKEAPLKEHDHAMDAWRYFEATIGYRFG